ncbi:MAG: hypothetical protein ACRDHP_04865 [Ktedonobacterales bacterium]
MNLFALELSAVLERRGWTLGYLYTLHAADGSLIVAPAKTARLQRSLSEDITATLDSAELSAVASALDLEAHELRRLRAAMTGEALRKLLAGRISGMSAHEEGERIVGLLVEEGDDEEELRGEMAARVHATGDAVAPTADINAAVAHALEAAAEACERGELWLAIALASPDADFRDDLLALAWNALDRAAQMLAYAPHVAQGSAVQAEWRETVARALARLREIRPFD